MDINIKCKGITVLPQNDISLIKTIEAKLKEVDKAEILNLFSEDDIAEIFGMYTEEEYRTIEKERDKWNQAYLDIT